MASGLTFREDLGLVSEVGAGVNALLDDLLHCGEHRAVLELLGTVLMQELAHVIVYFRLSLESNGTACLA
jgi:hypothetical protein